MIQTKVAMIRKVDQDKIMMGALVLNCKCGAEPKTSIDTKEDVKCSCGKTYTYNGWVK